MSSNSSLAPRLCLAAALLAFSLPAAAEQEPYGENIQGWKFTQDFEKGKALCRAFGPMKANVYRDGDGKFLLTQESSRVPKGKESEANFEAAGDNEMVTIYNPGNNTMYVEADDFLIGLLLKGGNSFRWRTAGLEGSVSYGPALGAVIKRLRECTKANGGK